MRCNGLLLRADCLQLSGFVWRKFYAKALLIRTYNSPCSVAFDPVTLSGVTKNAIEHVKKQLAS